MRRRTFLTLGNEGISTSEAMACDICLYNKTTDKLLIVEAAKFNINEHPSSNYSPVGVVVIPGSHDVYGDGSCAVISLKEMNCNTPDTGSTDYQTIYWGHKDVDISNMTNYDQVCYVGSNSTVNQTVQGVNSYAFLPSDKYYTLQNPYDKDTWFYYDDGIQYNVGAYYIPSPYNEDDTRNTEYYRTSSPSSSNNAMSDFDGVGNTTKLINLATAQSDWKTASTITNNSGNGYSPAACCCWRYHTDGTKQGDWYLPAMGELGYIMPKLNKINQAINLITAYGSNVGVKVNVYTTYCSSSESGSDKARCVFTGDGCVNNYIKNATLNVRAFLRVK